GPIGCEMAQAFARFGTQVTLLDAGPRLLPRDDADAAAVVTRRFEREQIRVLCQTRDLTLTQSSGIQWSVGLGDQQIAETTDAVLLATGRRPNLEGLNLEAVEVDYQERGVVVNDHLQTTNPRIYAAGDVCSNYHFTHAADFMARIVIRNALFLGRGRMSRLLIPWCTYTSPEVAHVGLTLPQAEEQGMAIETFQESLQQIDRAILDGQTEGFVKVHVRRGTDRIVGATIVASHAGDLISELTTAIQAGAGLQSLANTIHPYPTQADAIRRLGDQYQRTRLTPFVKRLFQLWFRWLS
ncbi:MAG: FAD-dependent oxidoreductase, partial [Planctomycetaceae bacterium]|nr:FAD-dependent oxidoreductase [Planctomycetaceae bacterium]